MTPWRIRPSAASRTVACPGSVRASESAPSWIDDYSDATAREEGTACHEFAATRLQTKVLPAIGQIASNGVPCDSGMLDAIHLYETTLHAFGCTEVWVEKPLVISAIENCGGTPDFFGWQKLSDGSILIDVADLKYGFRTVASWINYQLIAYAAGVCEFLGVDIARAKFRLTIVQPRKWHPQGPVRSVLVSGVEVLQHLQVLVQTVALSNSTMPPLIPGTQCNYCPGRICCSANSEAVHSVGFDTANDISFDAAERELKVLLQHREMLEARITGLSAQVEHAIRAGQRSTQFEMQSTSGKLEWREETEDQARAIAKCMRVDITKKPELITPTQAKRLVGNDFVNLFAHRVPGAKKLVLSDPSKWVKRFES